MKLTLVYSTRIKLWLGCDSRLENSASLFAPVAMEVGCLAFAAAVPYRDVQLFPAPAALHHARVSCVGFVRGGCVSPRAKSTADEGDDHGHHEEGYFVWFAQCFNQVDFGLGKCWEFDVFEYTLIGI